MSDAADMSLLADAVLEVARELRLMRLQMDNMASRLTGHDGRLGGVDARIATMEQSVHELVSEVSLGLGQMQQQITRQEKRFDALDGALVTLRTELADSNARILAALSHE